MITFITAFKNFIGSDRAAQRSAIWSWERSRIKAIAPNNESFIKANCRDFSNVELLDNVVTARSKGFNNSCPLLNDLIRSALDLIETPMVAFINGDIIIDKNFKLYLSNIISDHGYDIFLSGTRFDIDLKFEINTEEKYSSFLEDLNKRAVIYNECNSADIFITSKSLFHKMAEDMPPLVLGRYGWDNWIHFWAVANNLPCFNCTNSLITIHCRHDHSHISHQEKKSGRKAPSSVYNLTHLRNMQNVYGNTVRINKWTRV